MGWINVADVVQLAEADAIEVQAPGRHMALFRVEGDAIQVGVSE